VADATFQIAIEVDATNARTMGTSIINGLRSQTTGLDGDINKLEKSFARAGGATKGLTQNLSTTRYALYDVASTLAVTGGALLGLAVGATAVAVAWEKDFAQVVRTTGVVGDAVGDLRNDLVDLAQTMPASFANITEVATLAGQLGVAQDRVASFTETVIKFSAVTNLTVGAAATAFGRLDALLPDVNGNYEALGSAIAKVGVESVATESQIVNIATQISSMGVYAGLTASEVVGLSGALASIGAAPEISRGTFTRLFTEMSEAIANGGDDLENFAKVAGVTTDEFAKSFGTDKFGPIFQSFVEGLNDTSRNGGNAVATLKELGITSSRDIPLLLRLAGAGTLLGEQLAFSAGAMSTATELSKQYGIIAATTAARLQILVQNFMAFLDAVGSANLGPLGDIVDSLSGFFGMLTDIASTDVGGYILGLVTILTAFAGVLGLAGGALALFGASSIGLSQGLAGIVAIAPRASALILGAGTASAIASGEMKAASISAKLLGTALKALSVIGLILVLPDIAEWLDAGVRGVQGLSTEFDALAGRLKSSEFKGDLFLGGDITKYDASFQAIGRAIGGVANRGYDDIKRLDEAMAGLVQNGSIQQAKTEYESLRQTWVDAGGDIDAFEAAFVDTTNAIKGASGAATEGANGFSSIDEAMAATEEAARASEQAINDLRDAILNLNETGINAEEAELAFKAGLDELAQGAADATVDLSGTNDASRQYIQSMIDMETAARNSAVAIIDNGGSIEEAMAKYNTAREAIIAARVAKTGDAAEAEAWADRVLGSAAEAEQGIRQYSDEVNRVPEYSDTDVRNNAPAAGESIRNYIHRVDEIPSFKNTTIRTTYETVGAPALPQSYYDTFHKPMATGGPIYGPGTGTSDSILTRLSNGEYVIKAAAASYYGPGLMSAINNMRVPKFASGGPVGGGGGGGGGGMLGGVVELGPQTMAQMSRDVTNNILLDDVALSRAVQRGDQKRRSTGDSR
jgi:TP901 family phage tail tape measure protein